MLERNIFDICSAPGLIKNSIKSIESGQDIRIEITQFFLSLDIFQHIRSKIVSGRQAYDEATQNNDLQGKLREGKALQDCLRMQKQQQIGILQLIDFLNATEETPHIKVVKEHIGIEKDLRKADQVLNSAELASVQAQLMAIQSSPDAKLAEIYQKLISNANEFLLKAQLTTLQLHITERFTEAVFYFDKGLISARRGKMNTYLSDYLFVYCSFLETYNSYNKATPLLEELIAIDKQLDTGDLEHQKQNLVVTLKKMVLHYLEKGDLQKVFEFLPLLADLSQRFYAAYPLRHFVDVAELHQLKARVSLLQGNISNALAENNLAFEAFNQCTADYHQEYIPRFIECLNANVKILNDEQCFADALLYVEQADKLLIETDLVNANPYEFFLANKANTLIGINDLIGAGNILQMLCDVVAEKAREDPHQYNYDLCVVYNNLAVLYSKQLRYDEALEFHFMSLVIRETYAASDAERFLFDVSMTENNIGFVYFKKTDFSKAIQHYNKAIEIRKLLAGKNSNAFRHPLARSLKNRAESLFAFGEMNKAFEDCSESLIIVSRICDTDLRSAMDSFIGHFMDLITLCNHYESNLHEIINLYLIAEPLFERAAHSLGEEYQSMYADLLNNLSLNFKETRRYEYSILYFKKLELLFQNLAKDGDEYFIECLIDVQEAIADVIEEAARV